MHARLGGIHEAAAELDHPGGIAQGASASSPALDSRSANTAAETQQKQRQAQRPPWEESVRPRPNQHHQAGQLQSDSFPAGAAGLDSWANVFVQHVEGTAETSNWNEALHLADGTVVNCKNVEGPKGIPIAKVVKKPGTDAIDLVPLPWLHERWCTTSFDDEGQHTLITPRGRNLEINVWEGVPYLSADQLEHLFDDLPQPSAQAEAARHKTKR